MWCSGGGVFVHVVTPLLANVKLWFNKCVKNTHLFVVVGHSTLPCRFLIIRLVIARTVVPSDLARGITSAAEQYGP